MTSSIWSGAPAAENTPRRTDSAGPTASRSRSSLRSGRACERRGKAPRGVKPGRIHRDVDPVLEPLLYMPYPVARIINLLPPDAQRLWSFSEEEARGRLLAAAPAAVLERERAFVRAA